MKSILLDFFRKKGIPNVEALTGEEKDTFDRYDRVLSKEELSVEDIKMFLGQQIDLIESKWRTYDLSQAQKAELIPYHTVYKALLMAIQSPLAEKKQLEDYLRSQTK